MRVLCERKCDKMKRLKAVCMKSWLGPCKNEREQALTQVVIVNMEWSFYEVESHYLTVEYINANDVIDSCSCLYLQKRKKFLYIVICLPTEYRRTSWNVSVRSSSIGSLKWLILRRGENRSTRRKTSRSKRENQQQTQPTYGVCRE